MEPVSIGYSTKNIAIAHPNVYLRYLIEKTQSFLQRVRWKAYHSLVPPEQKPTKETYGFRTTKSPPPIDELREFEGRMLEIVQHIEFKHSTCKFQQQLSRDTKKIHNDKELLIPADKSTNFYRVKPASYNRLLHSSINKSYKKAQPNETSKIISEEKRIAKDLQLDNRIDALAEKDCFITLKDHKPNFNNKPICRLINPAKSEIGIISKRILERINKKVIVATALNQWNSSTSFI